MLSDFRTNLWIANLFQGDEEKLAGETPPAMMDRNKQSELPSLEVTFL